MQCAVKCASAQPHRGHAIALYIQVARINCCSIHWWWTMLSLTIIYIVYSRFAIALSRSRSYSCSADATKKIRIAKKMGKIVLMQSILFSDWKLKHWKSMWYVLKWCEARFFMHVDEFQNNFDRFILIVSNSSRLKYKIRSCACEIKSAINWKIIFAPQMQFNHNYFAFLTPQISLKSSIRLI